MPILRIKINENGEPVVGSRTLTVDGETTQVFAGEDVLCTHKSTLAYIKEHYADDIEALDEQVVRAATTKAAAEVAALAAEHAASEAARVEVIAQAKRVTAFTARDRALRAAAEVEGK